MPEYQKIISGVELEGVELNAPVDVPTPA